MNLTALLAAIQAKGYGTDTAAQQTQFLNEAYREVCGMQRWMFLEKQDASLSTAAGVGAYTLPMSDWRSIDAVRIEVTAPPEYYDLEYVEPQALRDMEHVDRDIASPFCWSFFNQQLHFYPVPDQAYTVRVDYIMQPADLAAGTDVPVLPIGYHDILVWAAIESIAYRERDWLGRQFAETKKETLLKRMAEEYQVRQRQTSSYVKSSGYWGTSRSFPVVRSGL